MKKYNGLNDVSQAALIRAAREAVAGALAGDFPVDPLIGTELSRALSCIGSVVKRHGGLIEMGIAGALVASDRFAVLPNVAIPLTKAALQLLDAKNTDETLSKIKLAADFGSLGHRERGLGRCRPRGRLDRRLRNQAWQRGDRARQAPSDHAQAARGPAGARLLRRPARLRADQDLNQRGDRLFRRVRLRPALHDHAREARRALRRARHGHGRCHDHGSPRRAGGRTAGAVRAGLRPHDAAEGRDGGAAEPGTATVARFARGNVAVLQGLTAAPVGPGKRPSKADQARH